MEKDIPIIKILKNYFIAYMKMDKEKEDQFLLNKN